MINYKAPWTKHGTEILNSDGEIVCDTLYSGEQWEADNANLIACAPEMCAELERLKDNCMLGNRALEHISRIERLLTKVRGEHETTNNR